MGSIYVKGELSKSALTEQVDLVKQHGPSVTMSLGGKVFTFNPQSALSKLLSFGVNTVRFEVCGGEYTKREDYKSDETGKASPWGTGGDIFKGITAPTIKHNLAFCVPDDYQVYEHNEKDYKLSNPADIQMLRISIWHEILETTFLYTSYLASGDPFNIPERVSNGTIGGTLVHATLCGFGRLFKNRFYPWPVAPSDPPFNFWGVETSSGQEIIISYGYWPKGFTVKVFDNLGEEVTMIIPRENQTGPGRLRWGKNHNPGVYFMKVDETSAKPTKAIKVTLIK